MTWLILTMAILTEVSATLCLRIASQGKSIWYVAVGVGYLLAFTLLSLALDQGMNLGVAYGTWAAAGVALTAVASRIFFKEHLTPVMMVWSWPHHCRCPTHRSGRGPLGGGT